MVPKEERVFVQLGDLCVEIPLQESQIYHPPTIQEQIQQFQNPLCVRALFPLYVLCFIFIFVRNEDENFE